MEAAVVISRTPEVIAAEINNIKKQTMKMLLYNSIEIGRCLVEAKACVPHGEWGNWLENNVDYSQSTANNLMRIYEEYGSAQPALFSLNAKSQALGNMTYTQAIALLGVPREEREKFIEEHDIENMSTRELQKAIKERDEALKEKADLKEKLNAAEKEAKENSRAYKTVSESYDKLEKTNKGHYETAEKLRLELEKTKKHLAEAQASGDSEEVKRLQDLKKKTDDELKEANDRITELEKQLKDKPIEAVAAPVIEKIPDDVQKELEELRKSQKSASTLAFKLHFEALVKGFGDLLGDLAEIEGTDREEYERYKKAVTGLIERMADKFKNNGGVCNE